MKRKLSDVLSDALHDKLKDTDIRAMTISNKISSIISNERIKRNMSQEEFANFMDVPIETVSKWETQDYDYSINTLVTIADKLNLILSVELSKDSHNKSVLTNIRPYDHIWDMYYDEFEDASELDINLYKLSQISSLDENWDENGAPAFSQALIDNIRNMLPLLTHQPEIFPLSNGSIQIEYEKDDGSYLEFEINNDFLIKEFSIDCNNNENTKEYTFDINTINNIIDNFINK